MKQVLFKILDMAWRVLVIAIGYTLALVLTGMLLGMLGLLPLEGNVEMDATAVFQQMFVGGLVMGLILGLVARQLPTSPGRHVFIWSVLLFANIGSVIIEGYFFVPDLVTNLGVTLAQQLLPCLVTAVLVYRLFAPRPTTKSTITVGRNWFDWLWRYALSVATYLAAYWLFGAISFALVTRPYYETQGSPLAVPDPQITLQAELIRAVLIVLSLLPFLLTAKMALRQLAIWSGLLLFVVGGIVPLTWQMATLPPPLLLASAVEIFCQNFTTGVVTALLMAGKTAVTITPRLRHT